MSDPRQALGRASEQYRETERRHEQARQTVIDAVVVALRAGVPPVEVVALSPFSPAYVRALAREHGVPPAPGGVKPRKRPS
jgi:hypothetical protein